MMAMYRPVGWGRIQRRNTEPDGRGRRAGSRKILRLYTVMWGITNEKVKVYRMVFKLGRYACFFLLAMPLKNCTINGMASRKASTSHTAWQISTPFNPKK